MSARVVGRKRQTCGAEVAHHLGVGGGEADHSELPLTLVTTTGRSVELLRDLDELGDGRQMRLFDTVGGELQERSLSVLKPGGIYVTPAGQPDAEAGQARGVRASGMMAQANAAQFREIAALIDAGTVKPVVSTVLPLAEAAQAHRLLEAGHTRGKLVLHVEA